MVYTANDLRRTRHDENPFDTMGLLSFAENLNFLSCELQNYRQAANRKSQAAVATEMRKIVTAYSTKEYTEHIAENIQNHNIRDFERRSRLSNEGQILLIHAYTYICWNPYRVIWTESLLSKAG
ncbi:MAG: hypothetical protein AAFW83_09015 [Pseudomonadota bacterium]